MSEAREIAEYQLETAIKDVLLDEFEACWTRLKEDSAVSNPEDDMAELVEWFSEQVQAAIDDIIEQDPDEADEDSLAEDEDDDGARLFSTL